MFHQYMYQFPMLNPAQRRFWELGGEDPDWGHINRFQGLERSQLRAAVHELICAVVVKDIANRTKNKELLNAAMGNIETMLDDFCGTPPRRKWPFPGPPPHILQVVSELSLLANSLQPGGLRTELEDVATKLMTRTSETPRQ